jgi:hypothetical protein
MSVNGNDQTVDLVADDLGKNGSAWRETDCEKADPETVIQDLLTGEYRNPIRMRPADRWLQAQALQRAA